jgi:hypothetical protein
MRFALLAETFAWHAAVVGTGDAQPFLRSRVNIGAIRPAAHLTHSVATLAGQLLRLPATLVTKSPACGSAFLAS